MNYIKECLEDHGKELIDKLKGAGFSNNQIIDFLPEAALRIASLNKNQNEANVINNLLLKNSSSLLNTKNISQIETFKGLSTKQVISGFKVVMPLFLKSFLNSK